VDVDPHGERHPAADRDLGGTALDDAVTVDVDVIPEEEQVLRRAAQDAPAPDFHVLAHAGMKDTADICGCVEPFSMLEIYQFHEFLLAPSLEDLGRKSKLPAQ
jgi:hypothetical protein